VHHRAANYLKAKFAARAKRAVVEAYTCKPADSVTLRPALLEDANDYYYSSCLSVVDGLRGVDVGFFTWSTVKLYYSVFYALRAIMAWNRVMVFHPENAGPYSMTVAPGAHPEWMSGKGTHKALLGCFRRLYPTHPLLSQDIELVDGLQWLLDKREGANYVIPRFCEPGIPSHYEKIVDLGVRKATTAYLGPEGSLLAFDRDHSIVAFPLAVLQVAGAAATAIGGAGASDEEVDFLKLKCRERKATLAPLMRFISTTIKSN
jgi:hypothetical protein